MEQVSNIIFAIKTLIIKFIKKKLMISLKKKKDLNYLKKKHLRILLIQLTNQKIDFINSLNKRLS